ncbi:hypothetical protein Emed_007373 [Eimeria media]
MAEGASFEDNNSFNKCTDPQRLPSTLPTYPARQKIMRNLIESEVCSIATRAKPAVASFGGMESLSSSSASSVDDALQEGPDEGPVRATSRSINGPNEGVSHHEDEEVIHVGDEGLPLRAEGPKKSEKHADIETTGEDEEESISLLTKFAATRFSGVKHLALIAAVGVMLALFGRRPMRPTSTPVELPSPELQPSSGLQQPESQQENVLLPPVEEGIEAQPPAVSVPPEEPPPTDIEELKSQQLELGGKIGMLKQAWRDAAHDVRMLFGPKIASFKKRFSGDSESDAVAAAVKKHILDDIWDPADKVRKAPIPTTGEGRVTLRRQLLLMNACVSVTQRQLAFWQDHRARRGPGEEMKKSRSMSLATFRKLIEGWAGKVKPEVLDEGSPQIPGTHAWEVAMCVAETKPYAVAAADSYKDFAPLMKDLEDAEHPADAVHVPEGGVFPIASFISTMKKIQESRLRVSDFALQAAKKLENNFTVEEAEACSSEIWRYSTEEAQALIELGDKSQKIKTEVYATAFQHQTAGEDPSTFDIRDIITVTFLSPVGKSDWQVLLWLVAEIDSLISPICGSR